MSDLQRSVFKPQHPALSEVLEDVGESSLSVHIPDVPEIQDDDSSSASSASSVSSTGTIVPTPTQNLFARPQG